MNGSMVENQMLIVPLKVTSKYDLAPALTKWIRGAYVSVTPEQYRQDLLRLTSIRNCISSSLCTHFAHKNAIAENALRDCVEYHAVLEECENIGLPIVDDMTKPFDLVISWKCAFERDAQPKVRSNIRHERICVLFNIGALVSYVASAEDILTKGGLARAVHKYNESAGIFHYIRTKLLTNDQNPSNDLSKPCLEMCEKLMQGQSQVCIYEMARLYTKPGQSVLAKLAMGAAELYGEAFLLISDDIVSLRMSDGAKWKRHIKIQSATFRALAEFHECEVARENASKDTEAHGYEIARLRYAESLCNDGIAIGAKSTSSKMQNLQSLRSYIVQRRIECEHDNRHLYRNAIPDQSSLETTKAYRMAKILPLSDNVFSKHLVRPMFTSLKHEQKVTI